MSENQRGELLLTDIAHQLTSGGGKPRQGYPCVMTYALFNPYRTQKVSGEWVEGFKEDTIHDALTKNPPPKGPPLLISSAEGSPAKTCPSPDDEPDSQVNDPASSTSSPASQTLFNPDGFSLRTYPDSSPRTAVGTSESLLQRWPTSGTAWHGGFSTAVSSECRSDADACSSSEPSLTEILEPPQNVPDRYSLSARAALGILRRADNRGRTLPSHLLAALEQVARTTTTDKADG